MENLGLIDWGMLGAAGLWIAGLALLLSALGFADSRARRAGTRFRDEVQRRAPQICVNVGLTLFCLGLLASARGWLEGLLWGLLAAAFAYFTMQAVRSEADGGEE
jgi:hypothetical protein